ncbi:MAG: 50S ribosomal protein L21 [Patescibacteria group bacterium]
MHAVIKTGGKQYVVTEQQQLDIEKIEGEEGAVITLKDVLLVSDDKKVTIGTPMLEKAAVQATILKQGRARKIRVVKFKSKVRYHKVQGHRQPFTKIQVTKISAS